MLNQPPEFLKDPSLYKHLSGKEHPVQWLRRKVSHQQAEKVLQSAKSLDSMKASYLDLLSCSLVLLGLGQEEDDLEHCALLLEKWLATEQHHSLSFLLLAIDFVQSEQKHSPLEYLKYLLEEPIYSADLCRRVSTSLSSCGDQKDQEHWTQLH